MTSGKNWKKAALAAAAAAVAAAPLIAAPAHAEGTPEATLEVIATGLANPRDITYTWDGSLLVAESGAGKPGCAAGEKCLGTTGAIYKVKGGFKGRVVSGLASTAVGAAPGTPVIASGPVQAVPDPAGGYTVLSNLGGTNESRAALGAGSNTLGTLFRTRDGKVLVDLVDHETRLNPDGAEIHANPWAFVRSGSDYLFTDAGANTVVRARQDGTTSTVAVWPKAEVNGQSVEGVPTGIAKDRWTGTVYVADMPGMRPGAARIFKIEPGRKPELLVTGLTNLIDLEVTPDGNLLALSYTRGFGPTGPTPGYLAKIDTDTKQVTEINTGDQLTTPTGLEVDPWGRTYVTINSVSGDGKLVRVRY
ncbi:ScyD/ScyE family protein [Streptomyces sp. NRRL S-87]|uniref:ScyD/ScyE family protein n=1 Tax=Streptomyces sp. NRRL S-87 TaxID=1463920 RepID=UPI0004C0A828|nr:ScyD/ScyE family protein [Streptomyces sp. NRRL S-87]